jgi:hypothetical protein
MIKNPLAIAKIAKKKIIMKGPIDAMISSSILTRDAVAAKILKKYRNLSHINMTATD